MDAQAVFELVRRSPGPRTRHLLSAIHGYRERQPGLCRQRATAPLVVPLIISLGTPFRIALGREPGEADRQPSFAAGLFAGPVHIESDGRAECVQVDFTPLGARRCLGGAVVDLAGRMLDIGAVFGIEGRQLVERLGATAGWSRRFDLVEAFVLRRERFAPSREVAFAYRRLEATAGAERIAALAEEIGWSRKHLATRFRAEIGLGPKLVARMMRFERACRLAQSGAAGNWAMIAAESGYADQAHLVREFREMAGEPPGAWARRAAIGTLRLAHPEDAAFG